MLLSRLTRLSVIEIDLHIGSVSTRIDRRSNNLTSLKIAHVERWKEAAPRAAPRVSVAWLHLLLRAIQMSRSVCIGMGCICAAKIKRPSSFELSQIRFSSQLPIGE